MLNTSTIEAMPAHSWFAEIGLTDKKLEHATAVCEDEMIDCVADLLRLQHIGKLDLVFKPVVYALVFGALRVQGLELELAVAAPQAGSGADQASKSSASETPPASRLLLSAMTSTTPRTVFLSMLTPAKS